MAIYLGSVKISAVNWAGTPISRIYNGSTLVFSAAAGGGNQTE